jgi:hypothetical protein
VIVKRFLALALSAFLAFTPAWGQSSALIGVDNSKPSTVVGPCPPTCMVTPILQYGLGVSLTSSPTYSGFFGGAGNPTQGTRQVASAIAGKVSNLQVAASNVTANNVTFGLTVNGALSALQCSVGNGGGTNPGTTTGCSDTTDTITVNAGDTLAWESVALNGTATGGGGLLGALFTSTAPSGQESQIGATTQAMPTSSITFSSPAANNTTQTSDLLASAIMPTAGTLDRLRAQFFSTLGGSKLQLVVYKNGVATGIAPTCTGSTTCTDLVDSVSVVAGDTISIQLCPANTATCPSGTAPGAGNYVNWSMRWTPATTNQALALTVPTVAYPGNNTGNTFGGFNGGQYNLGTEAGARNTMPVLPVTATFSNLWVAQCPGPDSTGAGGVTRTLAVRLNGVSQTLAISMPGSAVNACPTLTVAHDATHSFTSNSAGLVGILTTNNTTTNGVTLTTFKTGAVVTVP